MDIALLSARVVLAVAFALAAVAKVADRAGSRRALEAFGVPSRVASPLALALPVAELMVAVALMTSTAVRPGAAAGLILLILFCAVLAVSLVRGRAPECRCFARLSRAPRGVGDTRAQRRARGDRGGRVRRVRRTRCANTSPLAYAEARDARRRTATPDVAVVGGKVLAPHGSSACPRAFVAGHALVG